MKNWKDINLPNDFLSNSNKIKDVINNAKSQQIIFFKRKKNGHTSNYEAFNFEFDNENVGSKLKDIVISSIDKNETCTLKPYTIEIENNFQNSIFELPSKDVCNFSKIKNALNSDDIRRINVEITEEIDPNFYILNFEFNEEQIIAFTHYSPATVFKGKWFFNPQAEVYNKCLSIITWVNCLYYRIKSKDNSFVENIVIFKGCKPKFEQIFDFKDDYKYKATNTIKKLQELKLISNSDRLEILAMTDEFLIKKLAKINLEKKDELVAKNFENLVKANEDFEELKVDIDTKNKCIIISDYATKDYIKRVLSLINTEPIQNLITEDKLLLSDNNISVQQRLFKM